MRILFTQRELIHHGGTEMFTMEAAAELHRRGHEVAVYALRTDALGNALRRRGIHVKTDLASLPWTPDIIHGQHHLPAIAALTYFPDTPAIYYNHGSLPWPEKTPLHCHISRYVVVSEFMLNGMETAHGIPAERIKLIKNFVDLRRFPRMRIPPEQPRRALVFGNNFSPGDEVERLSAVCADEGITLDKMGHSFGGTHPHPEQLLPEYDLVFAVGRCAMESLAAGCAVIPVTHGRAGRLITPENFASWSFINFAPRLFGAAEPINQAWFREQLQAYNPAHVLEAGQRLRAGQNMTLAMDQLEALYDDVVRLHAAGARPAGRDTLRDTAFYLEKIAKEFDEAWASTATLHYFLDERIETGFSLAERQRQAGVAQEQQRVREREREEKSVLERNKKLALKMRVKELDQKYRLLRKQWKKAVSILRRGVVGRWYLGRINRGLKDIASGAPEHSAKDAGRLE